MTSSARLEKARRLVAELKPEELAALIADLHGEVDAANGLWNYAKESRRRAEEEAAAWQRRYFAALADSDAASG